MHRSIENMVEGLVRRVVARPVIWLVVVTGIAMLLGVVASRDLAINTDSSDMIDPHEPFRIVGERVKRLFPLVKDQVLIVLRGDNPDRLDALAGQLVSSLASRKDIIEDVYAPTVDPFFMREALLLMKRDRLDELITRLGQGAPLLQELVNKPDLATFFDNLARAGKAEEHGVKLGIVASLYDEVAGVIADTADGRATALSWQRLFAFAEDQKQPAQRIIAIKPRLDFTSLAPAKAAIAAVREAVADLPTQMTTGVAIGITGDPVLRTEELQSVASGIEISVALSLVLVALLLGLGIRSASGVVASLVALLLALMATAGFAALAVGTLNLISIAFTVLMIGLGIDFAIHLLLHLEERLDTPEHLRRVWPMAARHVARGLLLAAITTSAAFFAFSPTRFVGMAQLGVISGAGVLIALLVTLIVVPALTTIWQPRFRPRRRIRHRVTLILALEKASPFTVAITLFAVVVAAFQLPKVRFDADPMNLRDPDSPAVEAFRWLVSENRHSPYRLDYVGDDIAAVRAFAARVTSLAEVKEVISIDSFLPADQDARLDDIDFLAGDLWFLDSVDPRLWRANGHATPAADVTRALEALRRDLEGREGEDPDIRTASRRLARAIARFEAAAQGSAHDALVARLDQAVFAYYPDMLRRLKAMLAPEPLTLAHLPERIKRRYLAPTGEALAQVLPAVDASKPDARARFVRAVLAVEPHVSGSAYAMLRGGEVVTEAMTQATVVAFLLAMLMVAIVLRRLWAVAMVMLPLAFASVLLLAVGVWLDLPFNFANVIVLPLMIGMGVDAAIHLVARARDLDHAESVFNTNTPRAILFSALTTMASFGTLILSHHRGTASMGELLLIALTLTLLATLVVLPAMLELRKRWILRRNDGDRQEK